MMMSSALLIGSPVHIGHDKIDAGNDGNQVGHHEAAAYLRDHLQVRERRCPDARAVGASATIADQIIAVEPRGGFDAHRNLTRRNHRPPTGTQEGVDQGLNVEVAARPAGWGCEWMLGLVGAWGHVVHALANDTQALADLLHAHRTAVIAVTIDRNGHLEIEVLVATVGSLLAVVPLHAGGAQAGTCDAPVERLAGGVDTYSLGAALDDVVVQHHAIVVLQARRHEVEQFANRLVPPSGKILGHPSNPEPARMHAGSADRFDDIEHTLPLNEHVEHWRQLSDILGVGAIEQKMAGYPEQFAEHHSNDLHPHSKHDTG